MSDVLGAVTAPPAVNGTGPIGAPPQVVDTAGQLTMIWPNGTRADRFVITTELFEAVLADVNAGRRMAAALDQVRVVLSGIR